MKIKRFFAPDIRQAMRMVKEELGSDAVIMSNKSVDGGVEIVAARDFDEQLIQSKLQKQAAEQLRLLNQEAAEPKRIEFVAGADHFWLAQEMSLADKVVTFFSVVFM